MRPVSRLTRLFLAVLVPVALAAACATGVPLDVKLPSGLSTLIDDANLVIGKLDANRTALPANVGALIDKGKALTADLSSATSLTAAKPAASTFVAVVDDILALVPKQPGKLGSVLTAIKTLTPVIADVAGVAMKLIPAAEAPTGMSADQARAVLRS